MEAVVFIGILGVSAGFFGILTLTGLGCEFASGDTLMSLVSLSCPF